MELVVKNLRIFDGGGGDAFDGSIGVQGGKLSVFPGFSYPAAKEIIDGAGLTAVPGFIDAHSHGDLTLLSRYALISKLSQGITTQAAGQCGISMFPVHPSRKDVFQKNVSAIMPRPDFPEDLSPLRDGPSFFRWLKGLNSPLHSYCFVGHGTLRLAVMGMDNRAPTRAELEQMRSLLRASMRAGALGLSTGLVYAPSCYAQNDELLSLLEVVGEEGGIYATHPRSEGDALVEARTESIHVARQAGVPLCLSHMKAAGRSNWGKVKPVLEAVDRAVEEGMDILMDNYPYLAGCTALNVSLPQRCFAGGMSALTDMLRSPAERKALREELKHCGSFIRDCGGFSHVMVGACPLFHDAEGRYISDYAHETGQEPFDAYCDILIQNRGLGLGIYFHMCPEDMETVFRHPLTVLGTDALLGTPEESPHPRAFGSTARAYRLWTDTLGLTPGQAIRRMTGLAADHLGLKLKGYLRDGLDADFVLLDLPAFQDTATFQNGNQLSLGVHRVYSMGKPVYGEGTLL